MPNNSRCTHRLGRSANMSDFHFFNLSVYVYGIGTGSVLTDFQSVVTRPLVFRSIFSIRASLISPFLQRNCFTSTVCTVDVFFLSQTATVMKVILSESRQIRFSVFRLDFHSQFSGSLEGTSCHLFEFCGFRLMTCSSAFYMVSKQVSVLLENSICYRSTRPVFIFYSFHDDIRHSGPVQPK